MAGNWTLRSIIDANKLVGNNYPDWLRNLRIVLRQEKLIHIIDNPTPEKPAADATEERIKEYATYKDQENQVTCLMLASMSPELQRQHEKMDAGSILMHLKELFGEQSRAERYEISKSLFRCKMTENSSVKDHVLKMISYIEKLAELDFIMHNDLYIDLVLQSLPESYSQFIMNFHMNKLDASLPELLSMLNVAEESLKKVKTPVMLVSGASNKKKPSGRKGVKKTSNAKKQLAAKKAINKPKGTCHHCGKDGHWRRNCKAYLAGLKAKKLAEASNSGVFMIDINLHEKLNKSTWVLDTGCGSHICNDMQELNNSRSLGKNEIDLRVGNGARVAAQAVGSVSLEFSTGLVISLDSCYFVPVLSRNLISVSCLDKLGFCFQINDGLCTISFDDIVYGTAKLHENGLYVIEQVKPVDILNISNKKSKLNKSNESYLWHCRLGHINEIRIQKLHNNGYLNEFDYESYSTCESCLIGKMTKTPFIGKG